MPKQALLPLSYPSANAEKVGLSRSRIVPIYVNRKQTVVVYIGSNVVCLAFADQQLEKRVQSINIVFHITWWLQMIESTLQVHQGIVDLNDAFPQPMAKSILQVEMIVTQI